MFSILLRSDMCSSPGYYPVFFVSVIFVVLTIIGFFKNHNQKTESHFQKIKHINFVKLKFFERVGDFSQSCAIV